VLFENGFVWQLGGKLPGLTGGDPKIKSTGCVDVNPAVWSFRPMWRQEGKLLMYLYTQNRTSKDRCGIGPTSKAGSLPIGKWFRITMEMKLNTLNKSDGIGRILVDGKKLVEQKNIMWQGVYAPINRFLFTTFYGGSNSAWSPPRITYSRMKNITIEHMAK
jgi:hypothetical protein